MDFEFNEEQILFRQTIREFAATEIAPLVQEAEETEEFPVEIIRRMGKLGYLCLACPREYGGAGSGKIVETICSEELGRVSSGIASGVFSQSHNGTAPLWEFGSKEQIVKYLMPAVKGEKICCLAITEPNAGSDVRGIQTTARLQGDRYLINGRKVFITNGGIADYVLVAAYTDKTKGSAGINLFIVEKGTPGFTVTRKLAKQGNRSSDTRELTFEDCAVPVANLVGNADQVPSFKDISQVLVGGRMILGGRGLGMAEASFAAALDYVKRHALDTATGKSQYTAFKLAEMATSIESVRWLIYRAAWLHDMGRPCLKESSMAKKLAYSVAIFVASEAMEIFGGDSQMREYPVARYLFDAKVGEVGEGTPEIQNLIISRELGL